MSDLRLPDGESVCDYSPARHAIFGPAVVDSVRVVLASAIALYRLHCMHTDMPMSRPYICAFPPVQLELFGWHCGDSVSYGLDLKGCSVGLEGYRLAPIHANEGARSPQACMTSTSV